jgi:hypothetical protein
LADGRHGAFKESMTPPSSRHCRNAGRFESPIPHHYDFLNNRPNTSRKGLQAAATELEIGGDAASDGEIAMPDKE